MSAIENYPNLKPFPKGVSGNPKGRPPGTSLSKQLEKLLNRPVKLTDRLTHKRRRKLMKEHIAQALVMQAYYGDVQAIREIFDRTEGKVTQPIEASGELELKHVVEEAFKRSRVLPEDPCDEN